jgi:hypothetical protein
VTIPDNTNMVGGTTFTKTWRIGNNGTCVWGPTYSLSHYSDERLAHQILCHWDSPIRSDPGYFRGSDDGAQYHRTHRGNLSSRTRLV